MVSKVKIITTDVNGLGQGNDRIVDLGVNDQRQGRIVRDQENENAIEIERGKEMEGEFTDII